MKYDLYDLFAEYDGELPELKETECDTERVKKLVLQGIRKPKIKHKMNKALLAAVIAASLSAVSITAMAQSGKFTFFGDILRKTSHDPNIPDDLPDIIGTGSDIMNGNISDDAVRFEGDDSLEISTVGMYCDHSTLMLSLEVKLCADIALPENACIIPYFTIYRGSEATELRSMSGPGRQAVLVKGDAPDTYYASYYLTEKELAGSRLSVTLKNVNTITQINECHSRIAELQNQWRKDANAENMSTAKWKKYWKEHDLDKLTNEAAERFIAEAAPLLRGTWSAELSIPENIPEERTFEAHSFKVTADLLSVTFEENKNDTADTFPVITMKDGTNIFLTGSAGTDWIFANTDLDEEKHAAFVHEFGSIKCYGKPYPVDDIADITVYRLQYSNFKVNAEKYVIYHAED